jgi:hypothetical protein
MRLVEAARVQVYHDAARRPLRDQQAQHLFQPEIVQRGRAQLEGEAVNLRVNLQGQLSQLLDSFRYFATVRKTRSYLLKQAVPSSIALAWIACATAPSLPPLNACSSPHPIAWHETMSTR